VLSALDLWNRFVGALGLNKENTWAMFGQTKMIAMAPATPMTFKAVKVIDNAFVFVDIFD